MNERVAEVTTLLGSFQPSDDGTETVARLYEVLDGFGELPGRKFAIPAILSLLERYPDVEMGTPGPVVHELEAVPGYEPFLRESLRRQPAGLTIWMANRIVNASAGTEREQWLAELRAVLDHPKATPSLKEEALHFLRTQQAEPECS